MNTDSMDKKEIITNKKSKKLSMNKLMNKSKNINKRYEERQIYDKLKAYNYFYTKIFINRYAIFDKFDSLTEREIDNIAADNNIHLQNLINTKGCKFLLLQVQKIILDTYKRMSNAIRLKVVDNINKQGLDEKSTETLIESEYIKALERVKSKLLQNGKFQNYHNTVINYNSNNFNSLLTIHLNAKNCLENFIYYIIYLCDFIYKILCNVSILHYKQMAIFDKLRDADTNIIYTIAKFNDLLDESDRFI
jgi:hypothetical protein